MVIHKAKMEIQSVGLKMINIIMFSFLVVELVREDVAASVMDSATASGKGKMEGGYSAGNF